MLLACCEILISKICFISQSCIRRHRRDERFEKVAVNSGLLRLLIALCVHGIVCLLHCVFLALLTRKFVLLCSEMEIAKKFFSTKMKISLIQHAAKRELERRPTHRSLHWVICNVCKLGKVLVVVNNEQISLADFAIFFFKQ